jgi:hypothetical protein
VGRTSDRPGTSRTSSKVSASRISMGSPASGFDLARLYFMARSEWKAVIGPAGANPVR